MKLVGISQRINFISKIGETRDEIDHRLIYFLISCGCLPVQIPNSLEKFIDSKGAINIQIIDDKKLNDFLKERISIINEYFN